MTDEHGTGYAAHAFDFDGTLVDTADLKHHCVQASLAHHGITVSLAWVAATFDRFPPELSASRLRRLLDLTPARLPDDTYVAFARDYWFANADLIRPIAAARAAVHAAARTAAIAVVSANQSDIVRHTLRVIGLGDLPWTIVGREHTPVTKPAPDCYLYAARLLGVDPGRCLAYEDSDAGVTAARAAGMDVIDVRLRTWK
ncbi:HAD family hydrolase [Streptomyces sp. NPDC127110]|uniref:HAD family hydrolase n=1 Tax=Streptomyces sp. NPDC127110 TaxID=3345362 RepID=UPI003630E125